MKNIAILRVFKVAVFCMTICILFLTISSTTAQEIEPTVKHDAGNIGVSTLASEMKQLDGNILLTASKQASQLDGEGGSGGGQTNDGEGESRDSQTDDEEHSAAKRVNGVLVELTPQELADFDRELYSTKSYDEYVALMATLAYYNGGVTMTRFSWWDETELYGAVEVPDVVGMTAAQAHKTITDAGFSVSMIYKYSAESTMPLGYCYAQEVPAGKRILPSNLKIFIQAQEEFQSNENMSPDRLGVVVPNVVGMSEADALSVMQNYGLSVSVLHQGERNGTKLGFCYFQNYPSGQTLWVNAPITICIQSTDYFRTVPNVVGMHKDEAIALLENLGFSVSGTFDNDPAKGLPINYCIAQSITAGTYTDKASIKLTLQSYIPPTTTPSQAPQPTATPSQVPQPTATPSQEPQPTATLSQEPQPTATP